MCRLLTNLWRDSLKMTSTEKSLNDWKRDYYIFFYQGLWHETHSRRRWSLSSLRRKSDFWTCSERKFSPKVMTFETRWISWETFLHAPNHRCNMKKPRQIIAHFSRYDNVQDLIVNKKGLSHIALNLYVLLNNTDFWFVNWTFCNSNPFTI